MKNRERTGLIFVIVGLIILFLLIYFSFFRKEEETETEPAESVITAQLPSGIDSTATTTGERQRDHTQYDISQEAAHKFNANDLSKMAEAFSERFGSFSNQSDYGNFTDLKIFMTDSLKEWADNYVEKLRQENTATGYYGVTTHALTTTVDSFDDKAGTAKVTVTTERSESTETIGGGVPYSQKLDLNYLKVNGEWLVDGVYWDKQ